MRIRGPKLLATRYEKPEMIGSLYLNPAYLTDTSRSLWEVCETTDAANAKLRVVLEPGWILVTPPNSGVFFRDGEDGRAVFLLAASSIRRIIPWTSDASEIVLAPGQILVEAARREEATRSGIIVVRSDEPSGTRSGTISAIGEGVENLERGSVVLFSVHAGVEMEVGGRRFLALDAESVLAQIEGSHTGGAS